ncbi:MAG: NAD(P)-dependent oxidoreductase [Paracoccaceae bacterium]|nr:NAD(P)-dependent oxidoreductase [Paracoccaceae bacterium]
MKGKNVLVTGGAGVIGLELVPKLVSLGAIVTVGDLKPRPAAFGPAVSYRQGDLNDLTLAELKTIAPEFVLHLAATFERSVETAGFYDENFHHNVMLSHHLMSLLREVESARRVVFASSYLIYDQSLYQFATAQDEPRRLAEDDPIRPRNLVGMAKLSHEMELSFLAAFPDCQFSTLSVRIYRGYGKNSRDVISRWVRALLDGDAITVYRPEGIFDYIYGTDSAEGLARLLGATQVTGVINLGTGRARRVGEVVQILQQFFPHATVNSADSEIPFEASEADIAKLRDLLGWSPEYDLETAIPEIIEHERTLRA